MFLLMARLDFHHGKLSHFFLLFPVFLLKYEAGTAFKLITTFLQKKNNKKNEFVVWYF